MIAGAVGPFLFGVLADEHGTSLMLWTTTAISMVAALVNVPLMFHPLLGPAKKNDKARSVAGGEMTTV